MFSLFDKANDSVILLPTGVISSTSFYDCNGPGAEAMLYFYDLLIFTLLPFLFAVLLCVCLRFFDAPSYRLLVSSQPLEFLWTILPTLALVCLSLPSLSLLYLLDETGQPSSTFLIQGHQWYWHYERHDLDSSESLCCDSYLVPCANNHLRVDASLYVPSGIVLRLLVTAADVLHSWAIPSWGLKADAVPGRLNQLSTILDRQGTYFGQCSELCGSNHSFMPIIGEVFY